MVKLPAKKGGMYEFVKIKQKPKHSCMKIMLTVSKIRTFYPKYGVSIIMILVTSNFRLFRSIFHHFPDYFFFKKWQNQQFLKMWSNLFCPFHSTSYRFWDKRFWSQTFVGFALSPDISEIACFEFLANFIVNCLANI